MNIRHAIALTAALSLAAAPALAQQQVYPSKGQSHSKQQKDESECNTWAQKQTGFDPSTPPPAQQEGAGKPVTGSGARAVGALGGAAVAGLAGGNAGTGAIVGAVGGGLTKRGMNAKRAKEANNANNANYAAASDAYWRARGACLSGRGYSVK